jgi:hypothetical protein
MRTVTEVTAGARCGSSLQQVVISPTVTPSCARTRTRCLLARHRGSPPLLPQQPGLTLAEEVIFNTTHARMNQQRYGPVPQVGRVAGAEGRTFDNRSRCRAWGANCHAGARRCSGRLHLYRASAARARDRPLTHCAFVRVGHRSNRRLPGGGWPLVALGGVLGVAGLGVFAARNVVSSLARLPKSIQAAH